MLNLPSILPASVAEQIRKAQVRAAILGQADAAWAIGAKCQAVYSADGKFYNATVEAVTLVGQRIFV
jgi:survival-of-motor-neuron-related-splicing factor 30